jgi:hypothetical protein
MDTKDTKDPTSLASVSFVSSVLIQSRYEGAESALMCRTAPGRNNLLRHIGERRL